MRLLRGLHNIPAEFKGCAATIGTFDGLHLGHQRIIHSLKAVSERHGVPTLVMLFEPQPKEFFAPDAAPARLANLREKLQDLKKENVDYVLCLPFNQALRSMSADAFIKDILISALGIKHLIVGDDFRFGCDRRGDYQLLREYGDKYGFDVQDSPTHELDAERISSTRIRSELAANNLVRAAHMLDRPYHMSGRIAYGRQLGRLLDTPTANVMVHRRKLPLTGVYAVYATLEESGEKFQGVANIGVKPTVTGDAKPSLEVHLFDFDDSLYHQHLTVEFAHKIRDEKKFDGIDALRAAIEHDKQTARQYFAALND